jgi:glycosyltransferase involved in cell wall biosynthesis
MSAAADQHSGSLAIVIPAWNEQSTIQAVVTEAMTYHPGATIVVVNDGSTDSTAALARAAGAVLIDLPVNLGVGGAMRAGYKYADREGYDWAVQLDADGQHDPAHVATLLGPLRDGSADLVIGSRFAGVVSYDVRGPRRWAMRLLSLVLSRVARTRLTDTTSGFKASNRRSIALFAQDYPAEYLGDTVESLVIAARAGLHVTEVPVAMRQRAGGRPSHSPVRSAIFLARALLALTVALTRPRSPRSHPHEEGA